MANLSTHRRLDTRLSVLLWVAVVGLTLALQWSWLVLYLDIRYTFGALRAGGQAGLSATDIFIHRPLVNRLLMSGLDHVTFGATPMRERLTLSYAIVFAGLAGAGLARALRGWTSDLVATGVGLATFTALAWAPSVTILQPEWTAALLSIAAISLGLVRGPAWVTSWRSPLIMGAGLLLAVANLQKYTTATTVLVAVGLWFFLHRRAAWMAAVWTAVLTALLLGLTLLNEHERQWFRDLPRLNQTGSLNWQLFGRSLWNLAWLNPILMLWPAAVILGFRTSRQRSWLIGNALALVVVLAGVIVQNGYFPYHYAALSVLAAGVATLSCGHWWERTGQLSGVVVVGLVWMPLAGWWARRSDQWRTEHVAWAVTSVGVVLMLSAGVAFSQTRGPRRETARSSAARVNLALTALVLTLVISFPAWPHTPYALFTARANRVSQDAGRAQALDAGRRIREAANGALVVYVGRQDAPYDIALPTPCHYPTATFLYRSAGMTDATSVPSLQENLACLRDPTARFLVLQPSMVDSSHAIALVRDTVAAQFDCEHPVIRAGSFLLCRRR